MIGVWIQLQLFPYCFKLVQIVQSFQIKTSYFNLCILINWNSFVSICRILADWSIYAITIAPNNNCPPQVLQLILKSISIIYAYWVFRRIRSFLLWEFVNNNNNSNRMITILFRIVLSHQIAHINWAITNLINKRFY